MVPISMKPNPRLDRFLMYFPFLSKPAAKPTGFLNVIPNNFLSNFGFSIAYIFRIIFLVKGILKSIQNAQRPIMNSFKDRNKKAVVLQRILYTAQK